MRDIELMRLAAAIDLARSKENPSNLQLLAEEGLLHEFMEEFSKLIGELQLAEKEVGRLEERVEELEGEVDELEAEESEEIDDLKGQIATLEETVAELLAKSEGQS